MTVRLVARLLLFCLGAAWAPEVTGCELDRAVRRYWADLAPGDLVETESVTEGRTHRSRMRTTATVRAAAGGLALEVRERLEGEGKPVAGEPAPPRVVTETIATYTLVEAAGKPAVLTETRVALDDGKPGEPREESIPLERAANRLPGLASYCVDAAPLASETVQTPAGTWAARRFRVGEADLWVSPDVPLGGLVKLRAAAGEETVDQRVVRVVKGTR